MAKPTTVAELRAQVEAAKKVAQAKFRADWGTDSPSAVAEAFRQTIPTSKSWGEAGAKARRITRGA